MKMNKGFSIFVVSVLLAFVSSQALADSKVSEVVDDSIITTKIKTKLLADKRVSSLKVGITTNNGIVFINGNVPTEEEAGVVVEIAASTPDIIDVDTTNLKVQETTHPVADSYITAKVRGIYLREKIFGGKDIPVGIHIETNDGIVYLTGEVDNIKQKNNTEKLTKTIKGVKKVESQLTVKKI